MTKVIELATDLAIDQAATLKMTLQPSLRLKKTVQINGDSVQRVHAAVIQLLMAFVQTRAAGGKTTEIKCSEVLHDGFQQLGLDHFLIKNNE